MTTGPIWLDRGAIEELHKEQIELRGGSHGIRDEGGLESALARPATHRLYGRVEAIPDLAGILCAGICQNHPFIDGNKRAAFAAAYVFMAMNGWRVTVSTANGLSFMLALASGQLSDELAMEFFRKHSAPI